MPNQPPASPILVHGFKLSGHCHRVELMLSLLDLPYHVVQVDLAKQEQKQASFLALNPFGQVPVIQDGDITLADSNAILVYLVTRYGDESWLPRDALGAAQVQRWLSAAAGELAYGPAKARLATLFRFPIQTEEAIARAKDIFTIMNEVLQKTPFLVGTTPTIADIANYSYTVLAPEGNISLEPYPHLRNWLSRIEALPGFIEMPKSAVGLRA